MFDNSKWTKPSFSSRSFRFAITVHLGREMARNRFSLGSVVSLLLSRICVDRGQGLVRGSWPIDLINYPGSPGFMCVTASTSEWADVKNVFMAVG